MAVAAAGVDRSDPLLGAINELAAGPIRERAERVDAERRFPEGSCRDLAATGAFGLLAGNGGGGLERLAAACEAIGGACASTGMVYLMHSIALATVVNGGGPRAGELSERLERDALGTLAFSERSTGAHFYSPGITASRVDGALAITGRKSFVTSASHADVYLVLVGSEDGEGADCYAIERGAAGVSFSGAWAGLGMSGNSSIAMELEDVRVGDRDRIGEPGDGGRLVFEVVAPHFLIGVAAVNVGIAAAALDSATRHITARTYADGTGLAGVEAIQHALAEMDVAVRSARLTVRDAARLGDAGDESAMLAMMEAKVIAGDSARSVTERALEACGGQAYTRALPIERHFRDARAAAVMAPTSSVLRSWIGKTLAGLPVP